MAAHAATRLPPPIAFCLAMLWMQRPLGAVPPVVVPATSPVEKIVELQLEDPLGPESKSYLDLDIGKTFARCEAPAELFEARRWVHDNGVDLMCESRDPCNGLVAYELMIRPSDVDINQPPEFAAVRKLFDKADAEPFGFISPGETLPRTYLFRTSDGAMGVLQISALMQKPSGFRIRYRILHEPPKPVMVRRAVVRAFPAGMATRAALQEQRLKQLRAKFGDEHPQVKQAEKLVAAYQELANVEKTEKDPELASLKYSRTMNQYLLAMLREKMPDDSTQVAAVRKQLEVIQKQIEQAEAKRKIPPTSQPAKVAPTTQPAEAAAKS